MSSYWNVVLNPKWLSSLQEEEERHKARHTKENTEGKRHVTMCFIGWYIYKPENIKVCQKHQKLKRGMGQSLPYKEQVLPTPGFQSSRLREITFCCVKPPSLLSFVTTVLENGHKSLPFPALPPSTRTSCLQAKEKWGLCAAQFTKQDGEGRHWNHNCTGWETADRSKN